MGADFGEIERISTWARLRVRTQRGTSETPRPLSKRVRLKGGKELPDSAAFLAVENGAIRLALAALGMS